MTESAPEPLKGCFATHAIYQPTEAEWRCPQCDADFDNFYIEDTAPAAVDNCPALEAL